ncbi:MAG: tRNA uridine-5-carboxymethylaminomethyl(34) synthesis GTPase MnmE [Syntrophomonadaceae bacterium]|jgi:tRNA modification GTPase
MLYDDIAAISTPPGEGGIAIIRMSGSTVIEKVSHIFRPQRDGVDIKKKSGYSLTLGWIIDKNGEELDQVLLALMRAPHSYTGEDTIEIHCHGGFLPARYCLEIVMLQGIRLAEPGEFTKRAFLNGKLDASQAEAVIDIIRAKSEKGMKLAIKQLSGYNSKYINNIEDKLLELNAMVEASLDFPDEVGELEYNKAETIILQTKKQIDKLIKAGRRSEIYRYGITIAISGKPNVGKSSLLNALLRKERAIVTDIPGTTRDTIEENISIKGIPIRLIDTAGIRNTEDEIEKIGVKKSQEVIHEADLVIFIIDLGSGINDEDIGIYKNIANQNIIIVANKDDLTEKNINNQELENYFPGKKVIHISAKEEKGLEVLEQWIQQKVLGGDVHSDNLEIMLNLRHRGALIRASQHLQDALQVMDEVPLDCLGVDIWGALEALGEITGKNIKEQVIDRMFVDFCIGK